MFLCGCDCVLSLLCIYGCDFAFAFVGFSRFVRCVFALNYIVGYFIVSLSLRVWFLGFSFVCDLV